MKINITAKLFTILTVILFSATAYSEAIPYRALDGELNASICVERPENMGLLNIIPTKALFSNQQTLILSGGEAGCIIVSPGKYSFTVTSPDPYPESDKGNGLWKSEQIEFNISKDQMIVFKLVPSSNDKGYSGKWELEKIK